MRGKMQGFIVYVHDHSRILLKPLSYTCFSFDHAKEFPEAIKNLAAGLADGTIKRKFHIVEGGIEETPKALPMLFTGGNTGKL